MDAIKDSTVFAPSSGLYGGAGPNLMATSFSKKIPYYVIPDTLSLTNREQFGFYLAALATSEEPGLEIWKSWVVTYVCLVSPAFSKMLNAKMFQPIQLPSSRVLSVVEIFEKAEIAIRQENVEEVGKLTAELASLRVFEGLPRMNPNLNLADANGEWTYKVIICHYSIMLFLAGKRVAGDNHSQVTVARPKALKAKAHLEDSIDLLEGTFRMSDKAHTKINDAWSEMGALRAIVFTEYSKFESTAADESQNLIWTTMHLLRFSGMSHAAIVFNFLQVCPWVHEIPTLRPALATYIRSVVEAARVDGKIFPYLKLIQGDKATFFQRKELEPLIACAVSVLTETNPTLAAYFTKPEFGPIVEAFNLRRQEKEKTSGKKIEMVAPKPRFEETEEEEEASDAD